MAITTSEPSLNIAGMAAVLPLGIAIGPEGLPAASACEIVERLFIHSIRMRIPPVDAAGVRAELDRLPTGDLHQRLATVTAAV